MLRRRREQMRGTLRGISAKMNLAHRIPQAVRTIETRRSRVTATTKATAHPSNRPLRPTHTADMRPILLSGHERALTQVKYNPDGDIIFSVSKDHVVCAWCQ